MKNRDVGVVVVVVVVWKSKKELEARDLIK
jgi:hypothetical protein